MHIDVIAGVQNIYHFCLRLMNVPGKTAEKKRGNRLTVDYPWSSDLKTLNVNDLPLCTIYLSIYI